MTEGCVAATFMSRVGGSNPRPTRYECVALPPELIRHLFFFVCVAFSFAECFPPPRPTPCQVLDECVALPTELIRHLFFVYVAFSFAECFPPDLLLVRFWTNALFYQQS